MAAVSLVPRNGAVAFGSYVADYAAFSISGAQSIENVTPYGSNTCSKNCGNGTPDFDYEITAFSLAHAANTPPQLPGAAATTAFLSTGYSTTYTLDTGVTEVVTMIVGRFQLGHGRMRAAVNHNISGKNAGDMVETWPTS